MRELPSLGILVLVLALAGPTFLPPVAPSPGGMEDLDKLMAEINNLTTTTRPATIGNTTTQVGPRMNISVVASNYSVIASNATVMNLNGTHANFTNLNVTTTGINTGIMDSQHETEEVRKMTEGGLIKTIFDYAFTYVTDHAHDIKFIQELESNGTNVEEYFRKGDLGELESSVEHLGGGERRRTRVVSEYERRYNARYGFQPYSDGEYRYGDEYGRRGFGRYGGFGSSSESDESFEGFGFGGGIKGPKHKKWGKKKGFGFGKKRPSYKTALMMAALPVLASKVSKQKGYGNKYGGPSGGGFGNQPAFGSNKHGFGAGGNYQTPYGQPGYGQTNYGVHQPGYGQTNYGGQPSHGGNHGMHQPGYGQSNFGSGGSYPTHGYPTFGQQPGYGQQHSYGTNTAVGGNPTGVNKPPPGPGWVTSNTGAENKAGVLPSNNVGSGTKPPPPGFLPPSNTGPGSMGANSGGAKLPQAGWLPPSNTRTGANYGASSGGTPSQAGWLPPVNTGSNTGVKPINTYGTNTGGSGYPSGYGTPTAKPGSSSGSGWGSGGIVRPIQGTTKKPSAGWNITSKPSSPSTNKGSTWFGSSSSTSSKDKGQTGSSGWGATRKPSSSSSGSSWSSKASSSSKPSSSSSSGWGNKSSSASRPSSSSSSSSSKSSSSSSRSKSG